MLNTMTTNGHSLISPSGASRWTTCSGSVRLTMDEENTTNAMAQRGTDIHQLGEMLLNGEEVVEARSVAREVWGDEKPSMFYANRDMVEEATNYFDYVQALATEDGAEIIAEAKVEIIGEYDVSGHIDATVISGTTLHVVDLKTGRGRVSAEENLQLQLYALGTLDEHEMFYDFDKVVLHIVQDNAMISNTHSWETTPEDLEDFREWVTERARLALQEDSVCTPSESACQWCSHASKCEALGGEVTETFETLEETVKEGVGEMSLEDIAFIMSKQKILSTAFKAYEQRITDELHAGNKVEGFKLVMGRKNKKWINENEAYDKLKSWLPLDDVAPRKLQSPTQVNKLLGGQISARKKNVFDTLYEVPEGLPQLAPSSDSRAEYIPTEEFEDL